MLIRLGWARAGAALGAAVAAGAAADEADGWGGEIGDRGLELEVAHA